MYEHFGNDSTIYSDTKQSLNLINIDLDEILDNLENAQDKKGFMKNTKDEIYKRVNVGYLLSIISERGEDTWLYEHSTTMLNKLNSYRNNIKNDGGYRISKYTGYYNAL